MAAKNLDVKQTVTNTIIELLEKGNNRFTSEFVGSLPVNASTGAAYRGINVLLLLIAAHKKGYGSNQWLTFKQAQSLGVNVRKGEKSTTAVFFSTIELKDEKGNVTTKIDKNGVETVVAAPFAKSIHLFNVEQLDSVPVSKDSTPTNVGTVEAAEAIIEASGARIEFGHKGAFYSPARDFIGLPNVSDFTDTSSRYSTTLHELTHWTGHSSRLNRDFSKRFGDEAYAFEELVAELGSAFLNCYVGLFGATMANHAGYLESWLKVLKNDKTAIFTAASKAYEAFEFIINSSSIVERREAA